MELRKEFEKEKGYDCYAYRQDYAGGNQYKDGFNDDYVEWLESKVNNGVLDDVSKCQHFWIDIENGHKKRCTECEKEEWQ